MPPEHDLSPFLKKETQGLPTLGTWGQERIARFASQPTNPPQGALPGRFHRENDSWWRRSEDNTWIPHPQPANHVLAAQAVLDIEATLEHTKRLCGALQRSLETQANHAISNATRTRHGVYGYSGKAIILVTFNEETDAFIVEVSQQRGMLPSSYRRRYAILGETLVDRTQERQRYLEWVRDIGHHVGLILWQTQLDHEDGTTDGTSSTIGKGPIVKRHETKLIEVGCLPDEVLLAMRHEIEEAEVLAILEADARRRSGLQPGTPGATSADATGAGTPETP